MAHKKAGGSSKNGRDSNAQRRGVKRFGGESVKARLPSDVLSNQYAKSAKPTKQIIISAYFID